ncbi:unnamed protein product [Amoebophrya sp. A25]|nr:unnamed protein product [Amoebophrya sp. A25]|eukprot:GSA25T00025474001.1
MPSITEPLMPSVAKAQHVVIEMDEVAASQKSSVLTGGEGNGGPGEQGASGNGSATGVSGARGSSGGRGSGAEADTNRSPGIIEQLRGMSRWDCLQICAKHGLSLGGFLLLPWIIVLWAGFELIPCIIAMSMISVGLCAGEYQRFVLRTLEVAVNALKNQVKELGVENEKFVKSNEEFAENNEQLTKSNEALTKNNAEFEKCNKQMQAQNKEFEAQNKEMQAQNKKFQAQNTEMAAQNKKLSANVSELEGIKKDLHRDVGQLSQENGKLQSKIDNFSSEVDRMADTGKALEKQVDFLKNVNKTISNSLVECTTPQLVSAFQSKMEQIMSDDGLFGKMMLPLEKTQKKYEEVLKQLTEMTERQERMNEEEQRRRDREEQQDLEHERRERKLQKNLANLLKQQEGYQGYARLLEYAEHSADTNKKPRGTGSHGGDVSGLTLEYFVGKQDEKKLVKKFKDMVLEHLNKEPEFRISGASSIVPSPEQFAKMKKGMEDDDLASEAGPCGGAAGSTVAPSTSAGSSASSSLSLNVPAKKSYDKLNDALSPVLGGVSDLALKKMWKQKKMTTMEELELWRLVFPAWKEFVLVSKAERRRSVTQPPALQTDAEGAQNDALALEVDEEAHPMDTMMSNESGGSSKTSGSATSSSSSALDRSGHTSGTSSSGVSKSSDGSSGSYTGSSGSGTASSSSYTGGSSSSGTWGSSSSGLTQTMMSRTAKSIVIGDDEETTMRPPQTSLTATSRPSSRPSLPSDRVVGQSVIDKSSVSVTDVDAAPDVDAARSGGEDKDRKDPSQDDHDAVDKKEKSRSTERSGHGHHKKRKREKHHHDGDRSEVDKSEIDLTATENNYGGRGVINPDETQSHVSSRKHHKKRDHHKHKSSHHSAGEEEKDGKEQGEHKKDHKETKSAITSIVVRPKEKRRRNITALRKKSMRRRNIARLIEGVSTKRSTNLHRQKMKMGELKAVY